MALRLTPVDYDPFSPMTTSVAQVPQGPQLTPVDYDPFAEDTAPPALTPVDYDPFEADQGILSAATNIGRGIAERAGQLAGGGLRFIGQTAKEAGDYLEERVPLGRVEFGPDGVSYRASRPEDAKAESPLVTAGRALSATDAGYEPGTTWEQVKDRPLRNFLPFAIEQGLVSVPDMAAVLVNLPGYVAARTGEIGQTRAENDQRDNATVADFVKAAPASIGSALLERFGARGMLGLDDVAARRVRDVLAETAKAGAKEGLTEAGQEAVEYAGGTVGTQAGFDPTQAADQALAGFVGGAPFGAGVRGVGATMEARAARQAEGPYAPEPAPRQDTPLALPPPAYTRGDGFVMGAQPVEVTQDISRRQKAASKLTDQIRKEQDPAKRDTLIASLRDENRAIAELRRQNTPSQPAGMDVREVATDRPAPQTEALYDDTGQQIGRWNPVTGEIVRGDAAPAQTAGPVAEPLPAPVTPADVASPLETRDISEGKALIGELLGESPQDAAPTRPPEMGGQIAEATQAQEAAREAEIEAAARRADPDAFLMQQELTTRRDLYRQLLDRSRAEAVQDMESGMITEDAATAGIDAEIGRLQDRIPGATPRNAKKYRARIADLEQQRANLATRFQTERATVIGQASAADTPQAARFREIILNLDEQLQQVGQRIATARRGVSASEVPPPATAISETAPAPLIMMPSSGKPYPAAGTARRAIRARPDLAGRDLDVVQIEGGWALRERPSAEASRAAPAIIETPADMRVVSQVVNTEPSDAQKAAGNYRKAHVKLGGLDIAIETPRGATRSGVDPDGQPWSVTQPADYGYIKRSQGADGDQLDVYVGPEPQAQQVYVIDQRDANTGQFDELKVMMGFPSQDQAVQTYQAAFSDGRAGERMGAVTPMSMDQFRAWLKDGDTTKPVASQQMPTPTPAPAERSPAPAQVQPPAAVASPPSGAPIAETPRQRLDRAFNAAIDESMARPEGPTIAVTVPTSDGSERTIKVARNTMMIRAMRDRMADDLRAAPTLAAPKAEGFGLLTELPVDPDIIDGGRATTPDAPQPAAPAASPAQTSEAFRDPARNMAQVGAVGNRSPGEAQPQPDAAAERRGERQATSPRVTDAFAAAAPEIERNLRARLDRLGLSDRVGLRVTDMIRSLVTGQDVPGAIGMYSSTGAQRLIQVSTAAPSPDAILHHEALHAMREMGLFSEREWQVLDRAAKADRERTARIERAYAGQLDGMDPADRADILTEEVIADMYADWSQGRLQAQGALETLFQRIRNFLRALRNALAGNGFRTERDVFQAMDRGEIGSREELPPIEPAERTQAEEEAGPERMAVSGAANRTGVPPGLDLSTPRRSVVEVLDDSTLPILQRLKQGGKPDAIAEQVDRWRAVLQDQFLPLLRTQAKVEAATGRKLDVSSDPYLQQELSSGRIGARLEDLTEQHVRPLYEDLHAAGISVEDLEAYLYARHAPERNKRISSINPKFGPGEGSGMTDADAAAIIRGVKASGKQAAYEAAAKRVDAILNMALETRVQAGLLSRQEADAWKATYQHYVPLRGKAELDPEAAADRPSTGGSGVTVRGRESYRAFGRETKAADILAYSIMQAEEAILRAETNEVAKAFYQLAKDNPDAGLWQADKVEMRPVLDKASGQVRYQRSSQISAEDKDYTVTAKIDGKEHRVTLNRENPVAIRLASAMRNLDGSQFGAWVRTVGSINRYLSTVNTTLNPEFMIVNAFRDLQTAGINLQQFDIPKLTRNTLKDYPAALKASMKGSFGRRGGDAWSKWFQEYRASGAPVSFNRMEDVNTIRSRIRADFAAAGPGLSARKAWRTTWGTIEKLNMGVEQAVRLAAYKNAREAGMSVERAASLAKNMTVNFNRKGSAGPIINSLYLFYNAGVQGTAALLSAAKSPRVRKVLYGAVLAGAALEIYNQMAGDDDDDGEAFYRKISENDKQRNLIVMLPGRGGEHIKIPLPYGYNVFYTLGRLAIATATGEKNAARAGVDLLTATLDSFNPIGGSGSLLNIIAPTIADPVVDLTRNRDYADRPIMPEPSPYTTPEPDSSTYWNNVSTPSKAFTSWLNEATGGDDVQPGAIDISPETLDYMAGFATGAAGSFFGRIVDLGAKMFDPQGEITANDLPLTRKVLGGKPGWYDKSAFYERAKQVDKAVDFLKRYEDAGNMDAADRYAAEKANLLDMEKPVRQTRKVLSDIRKERAALRQDLDEGRISRDAYNTEMKTLKDDEQQELTSFNADYLSWVGQ